MEFFLDRFYMCNLHKNIFSLILNEDLPSLIYNIENLNILR